MDWHMEWEVAQIIEPHSSFQSIDKFEYFLFAQVPLHMLCKLLSARLYEEITYYVLVYRS